MKRLLITEEEKNRIKSLYEQMMGGYGFTKLKPQTIGTPTESMKDELEMLKNELDLKLDEIISSGIEIDKKRFMNDVRNKTEEIFLKYYESDDEGMYENSKDFPQIQMEIVNYFKHKLYSI
jgi:hypothetical protein